jgi:hypothetical protein
MKSGLWGGIVIPEHLKKDPDVVRMTPDRPFSDISRLIRCSWALLLHTCSRQGLDRSLCTGNGVMGSWQENRSAIFIRRPVVARVSLDAENDMDYY